MTGATERGRRSQLIIGATVRTLGAWPAGWRSPNAHRNPREDREALVRIATIAETAGLHFLYFGDWLATSIDYEFTDPYLLARIEPLAAISYLAAVTTNIGLMATVSSSHSEPYSTARASASIDILSGGRTAISVSSGSEAQSASNFGWSTVYPDADRIAAAGEFIDILRGLWDSWEDDAFVADVESARLINASAVHRLNFEGRFRSAAGPLNVVRPPQGHPPITVVGGAGNARQLAARSADLSFVSPRTVDEAIESYSSAKRLAASFGRDPDDFLLLSPILPIVGETREEAWRIYDDLVQLVPVEIVAGRPEAEGLPINRTIRSLADSLGVSLNGIVIDDVVPSRLAGRFGELGLQLLDVVRSRSGRTVGGDRGVTFRHLLVARAILAPVIVGSIADIADHFESWFRRRAVDGFTVLSAHAEQFEAFATLVVPELKRRGLFPEDYVGITLRDHLGLETPENSLVRADSTLG